MGIREQPNGDNLHTKTPTSQEKPLFVSRRMQKIDATKYKPRAGAAQEELKEQRKGQPVMLNGLARLAPHYRAIFCDVWGVLHNGRRAFAPACAALTRFRAAGGEVVLLTNAPRPAAAVEYQCAGLGVPDDAYDRLISSGDVCRQTLAAQTYGARFYHIGPPRDNPLVEGLEVKKTSLEQADCVLCTGLMDDTRETAADYRAVLQAARQRALPFLCANPDLVVERGTTLIPCAGSLAALYEELGGQTVYFGKPHKLIYDAAFAALKRACAKEDILAVGDGLQTDIAGARRAGLATLFIASGVARADAGGRLTPASIAAASPPEGQPDFFMPRLNW